MYCPVPRLAVAIAKNRVRNELLSGIDLLKKEKKIAQQKQWQNALLIEEAVNPPNVCRTREHFGQNFSEISRTKSQEGCNNLVLYQLPDALIAQCYQDQLATKKKKLQKKKQKT